MAGLSTSPLDGLHSNNKSEHVGSMAALGFGTAYKSEMTATVHLRTTVFAKSIDGEYFGSTAAFRLGMPPPFIPSCAFLRHRIQSSSAAHISRSLLGYTHPTTAADLHDASQVQPQCDVPIKSAAQVQRRRREVASLKPAKGFNEVIQQVAASIRQTQKVAVVAGAGISQAADLATFRGPQGLYLECRCVCYGLAR